MLVLTASPLPIRDTPDQTEPAYAVLASARTRRSWPAPGLLPAFSLPSPWLLPGFAWPAPACRGAVAGSAVRRLSAVAATVAAMGKVSAAAMYECSECGWRAAKWAGRCGECQAWGTVVEVAHAAPPAARRVPLQAGSPRVAAVPIALVDAGAARARPTGMSELDRVLGGGLVPGAVVLLAGEPGVGKSTLLLEAGAMAARTGRVLYVTGEESAAQVRLRADRVGALSDSLFLAAETDFAALLAHVDAVEPALLIVDSVQTISAAGIDGVPGGVTQVREVSAALTALAKERTMTTVLVGHVTKDGSVAGPRTLEHLVD